MSKEIDPGKSLAARCPDIAKQWHPTKNGDLTPEDISYGSGKNVWWYLPYDDPKTGKHFDFEWQAPVHLRRANNCPFITGEAVWTGFNDLETTHPDIAAQWHPTKNGDLTPEDISYGSRKNVWWYLPYDDPKTGKHFDFEWQALVHNRTAQKGDSCPFISGRAVWVGFNDLETTHPDIAAQWHPTKNGELTPKDVSFGSRKKVWWRLLYDDPRTGKQFVFEWQNRVSTRTGQDTGCPYLGGKKVWKGYNDLAAVRPDIAVQWHPTKNGSLRPDEILSGSNKIVWWLLPYDDPETGKHFDFEWQDTPNHRTSGESGCPYLVASGTKAWPGFNDLETCRPDLAAQWHPTKNGKLTPKDVREFSNKKIWWLLPYDDPRTGKHFDFEWQAEISSRTCGGNGCPFLSKTPAVWEGFNDLKTLRPDLAAQWHPKKNGSITPQDVTCGSHMLVWWLLPYDDPETGKHFDFEWRAAVNFRNKSGNCPFVNGNAVWTGYNDLATRYPDIASEWHPRNRVGADKVAAGSTRKFWWICKKGHEWYTDVCGRTHCGYGCPKCQQKR